jgi:hypothetical protein
MKEYVLRQIADGKYYVFCLSLYNFFNYKDQIENEEEIKNGSGALIMDLFLIVGNGDNRLISLEFSNGTIDLSTGKNYPHQPELDTLALSVLQENYSLLGGSILTERQRELIKDGQFVFAY